MTNTLIPILFLAGGFGTRLRVLDSERPKPMILVKGKPFLHWLTKHYAEQGFRKFYISTGYLAHVIEEYPWTSEFLGCEFSFIREENPLGTGGAVKNIFDLNPTLKDAWIVNGDTLLEDPLPLLSAAAWDKEEQDVLFTTLKKENVFDATPNLHVQGSLVTAEGTGGTVFDAGAILVKRRAVCNSENSHLKTPFSIHKLLERAMSGGKAGFLPLKGTCYDIGTPERYKRFENILP